MNRARLAVCLLALFLGGCQWTSEKYSYDCITWGAKETCPDPTLKIGTPPPREPDERDAHRPDH